MNVKEFLLGKAREDGVDLNEEELAAAFSRQPDPKVPTLEAEQAALKAENERLRADMEAHNAAFARMAEEKRESEAVAFANEQIAAKKVVPASGEALKALAAAVSKSDSTATFAEGEKSQTALLREFIASLPDLSVFTTHTIKDAEFAVLGGQEKTKGVGSEEADPERVKKILAATPAGREVLKERENGANGKH